MMLSLLSHLRKSSRQQVTQGIILEQTQPKGIRISMRLMKRPHHPIRTRCQGSRVVHALKPPPEETYSTGLVVLLIRRASNLRNDVGNPQFQALFHHGDAVAEKNRLGFFPNTCSCICRCRVPRHAAGLQRRHACQLIHGLVKRKRQSDIVLGL